MHIDWYRNLKTYVYPIPIIIYSIIIIPPANEVAGVYSVPYVRPFVRSSVRPTQSLIHYSSKTAKQNFMKLSGIVHYMMPYCTSYFKFYPHDFGVSHSKTRTLPYKTWGSGGIIFVSIAHSISSFGFFPYR